MRPKLFLLVLTAAVSACGGSAVTTSSADTTTTLVATTSSTALLSTTSPPETTTTIAASTTTVAAVPVIRIEGGEKVEGLDTLSVMSGEQVVFDVLADVTDEVHVHGYDLHFDVAPGVATRVEFTADATGIFEVELEAAGLHFLDLEVTP